MVTLHYLADSRAQRILWMLEEIGIPYAVESYERNPKTRLAPASLKAIHPLGKSPVLTDDGLTIAESAVIVEHLAQTYAAEDWIPAEAAALRQYRYWMHYSEGSLMPLLLLSYLFQMADKRVPFLLKPLLMFVPNAIVKAYVGPTLATHMDFVERHLGEHTYFAGDQISAADVMMIFPLEASQSRVEVEYPNVAADVARVHARPAYQRALTEAKMPYAYAQLQS